MVEGTLDIIGPRLLLLVQPSLSGVTLGTHGSPQDRQTSIRLSSKIDSLLCHAGLLTNHSHDR